MIPVIRFQLSAYARSVRALHPILALGLLLAIVFSSPLSGTPAQIREGALTTVADMTALIFPICAWAARGLLDTEPDTQRHVTAVTAGRWRAVLAGSVAAYAFSVVMALIAPLYPLAQAAGAGLGVRDALLSLAMLPLSALAATALGALTSRAVISSPGTSVLVLLGVCGANLILGIGPLKVLTVPMIEWMRAASDGPSDLAGACPWLALRTLVWAAVAGALYAWLRRTRP